jgi:hypothetical protein
VGSAGFSPLEVFPGELAHILSGYPITEDFLPLFSARVVCADAAFGALVVA